MRLMIGRESGLSVCRRYRPDNPSSWHEEGLHELLQVPHPPVVSETRQAKLRLVVEQVEDGLSWQKSYVGDEPGVCVWGGVGEIRGTYA